MTPHGLNELVWNGNSPGRWDSASWSRPDGTPTTEIPDLNTVTTVASHRVAVDGPAGAVVVAVPAGAVEGNRSPRGESHPDATNQMPLRVARTAAHAR